MVMEADFGLVLVYANLNETKEVCEVVQTVGISRLLLSRSTHVSLARSLICWLSNSTFAGMFAK